MRVETFHTPGPLRLEIRVPVGSVAIETVDGEETRVEVEAIDGDEELEQATRVEYHGGRVVVAMEEERKFLFIRTIPGLRVRVACPHDVEVDVKTVSADVDAAAARIATLDAKSVSGDMRFASLARDVRLKSVSGDVSVGDAGGSLTAQTTSGDIEVGRVQGAVEVRTVSGDVVVEAAAAGATAQTVSGDMRLRSVASGKVQLKTVSGDMTVGIRSGSNLWLDAKSVSGDTSSELALGDAPPNGDAPLVELRANAMSGDIKIVRA